MIKWLSKLPIFKDVYRLGGMDAFPLAHKDILETMRDDLDKKAEELAEDKLSKLLSPVNFKAVVSLNKEKGLLFIGGDRVDDAKLSALKSEAEFFAQSDLWKLLYETPKELAHQVMFVSGDSIEDMRKGRSMLYTLDSQRKIIDILRSYVPKK